MKILNQNGHLTDQAVALYVDGLILERMEKLPEELISHVENCNECHIQCTDLYATLKGAVEYSNEPHPYFDRPAADNPKPFGFGKYILPLAVAFAILLWFMLRPERTEAPIDNQIIPEDPIKVPNERVDSSTVNILSDEIADKDEVPSKEIEKDIPADQPVTNEEDLPELIAATFEVNDDLEAMIGEVFRSNELEVLLPKNENKYFAGDPLEFKMNNLDGTQSPELLIMNNKGETVLNQKLNTGSFKIYHQLSPGLYYWKIETEDDLLHLGKIQLYRQK